MNKLVYIIWGSGIRRVKVNIKNYVAISKIGRYYLYERVKKARRKPVQKRFKKKRVKSRVKKDIKKYPVKRISKGEAEIIYKIKGGDFKKEIKIEKDLLKRVRLLPVFDRKAYIKKINPGKEIISDGRVYGSFRDLENNKRNIYMGLMKDLIDTKDKKFGNKLYALRRDLLKDGLVISVDVYGVLNKQSNRKLYLGTLAIVGLMIEDAGFIESDMVGWAGENRQIEPYFNSIVKGLGGEKCYWTKNNMSYDTAHVFLTNVSLSFNYA